MAVDHVDQYGRRTDGETGSSRHQCAGGDDVGMAVVHPAHDDDVLRKAQLGRQRGQERSGRIREAVERGQLARVDARQLEQRLVVLRHTEAAVVAELAHEHGALVGDDAAGEAGVHVVHGFEVGSGHGMDVVPVLLQVQDVGEREPVAHRRDPVARQPGLEHPLSTEQLPRVVGAALVLPEHHVGDRCRVAIDRDDRRVLAAAPDDCDLARGRRRGRRRFRDAALHGVPERTRILLRDLAGAAGRDRASRRCEELAFGVDQGDLDVGRPNVDSDGVRHAGSRASVHPRDRCGDGSRPAAGGLMGRAGAEPLTACSLPVGVTG